MSFTNIIGQEKVLKILSNTIKSNKISHAYIFAGNSSIGKKKTAVEFAKILNCLSPIDQITACENCRNCKKISSNNHPEIKIYNSENKNI
jgi:DNA polymerase-3 subunit delta'